MPRDREALLRRNDRERRIERAVDTIGHVTEYFAQSGNCSLGEAVVVLMRFEREGLVERGRNGFGMTWRAAR